jgi:hypothetical protein
VIHRHLTPYNRRLGGPIDRAIWLIPWIFLFV